MLTAAHVTVWLMGKDLCIDANTNFLIGVGTSICGGLAMAAVAPVIDADDRKVTFAISTIFLFDILTVLVVPHTRPSDQELGQPV